MTATAPSAAERPTTERPAAAPAEPIARPIGPVPLTPLPDPESLSAAEAVALLRPGTRMTRVEFHRVYERTPQKFQAELVEGIVHVASPVTLFHGKLHLRLSGVLLEYHDRTPGTDLANNSTAILGDDSEPQPDLHLRIRSDHGGNAATADTERGEAIPMGEEGKYLHGPPEFILEVAYSTRDSDLNSKRTDYAANGVLEYVVASFADRRFFWYDLEAGEELTVPDDGVLRSRRFPGLWIAVGAVFRNDSGAVKATLAEGLAAPEHAAFVQRLAAAKADAVADTPDFNGGGG